MTAKAKAKKRPKSQGQSIIAQCKFSDIILFAKEAGEKLFSAGLEFSQPDTRVLHPDRKMQASVHIALGK